VTGCCASTPPVAAGRPASVPGLEPIPIVDETSPDTAPRSGAPTEASAESVGGDESTGDGPAPSGENEVLRSTGPVRTVGDDFVEAPLQTDAIPAMPAVGCTALLGPAMRRSALTRTLDAGLGAWLRGLDIEPKVDQGRFQGWMIRAIQPGDPCWSEVDLREGDVIKRVNRRSIQRPDEAQAVWTALRASREIVVDYLRDGKPRTLRLPVVDDRK
jgi:hypothetical protein